MQAQTSAHALLPRALLTFLFFDRGRSQYLAAKLSHLYVQERRDDRDQRNDKDVNEREYLLINAIRQTGPFEVHADSNPADKSSNDHRDEHLNYRHDNDRPPRARCKFTRAPHRGLALQSFYKHYRRVKRVANQ